MRSVATRICARTTAIFLSILICVASEARSNDLKGVGNLVVKLNAQIGTYNNIISLFEQLQNTLTTQAQSSTEDAALALQRTIAFIDRYNHAMSYLNRAITGGPTAGDLSLIFAYTRLLDATTDVVTGLLEGAEVRALTDLGIFTRYAPGLENGLLNLDQYRFDHILSQSFKEVQIFFDGNIDGQEMVYYGFAKYILAQLEPIIGPFTGILTANRKRMLFEKLVISEHVHSNSETSGEK